MALAVTHLAGGDNTTDGLQFVTASISPPANALIVACIHLSHGTTDCGAPTLTGAGLDWRTVADLAYDDFGTTRGRMAVRRAQVPSPGSGAITIDVDSNAQGCGWSIFQVTGDVAVGPGDHGALAIAQVKTTADQGLNLLGTSGSLVMSNAAYNASSRPFSFWAHQAAQGKTPRTNWTELYDDSYASPSVGYETQYRADAWEDTASASWVSEATYGGIAFEVREKDDAQFLRPDADITTFGWATAPLFSKLNDSSDSTVISATAS
jgi:hypothetical protein